MSFFDRINAMTPAEALLAYLERGKSVFPVGPDKRPRLPWKVYQTSLATPYEAQQWIKRWPDLALGFPTGAQNGFNVLDADSDEAERWLAAQAPATPLCQRTRRGTHRFYRCGSLKIPTVKNLSPTGKVDARGEGGYVVIAPSVIAGHRYAWEIGSGEVPTLDSLGEEFFQQKKPARRHGPPPAADRSGELVYDDATGLIVDGRESYLCYVVLGVIASYVRVYGRLPPPRTTAKNAWDQFCKACDLSDGKWQFAHCEEKVAYALARVAAGTIPIHDDDEVIGDADLYEEGAR